MNLTHLKDADKNATYDTVITDAGTVLVARHESSFASCDGCIFDSDDLVDENPIVIDGVSCVDMPLCNNTRTDRRAIIWVRSTEPAKLSSPELQQVVNPTKESIAKKPAKKPYDPQETLVQLNNLLHNVASLNQTTNSLEILVTQVKRATDLLNRNDAGVSPWSAFLEENHRKQYVKAKKAYYNQKLSDAEFRLFISNSLKG